MFKQGEKVIFLPENKVYDFGYIGATGMAIIYEEGESNIQDSFVVSLNNLKSAKLKSDVHTSHCCILHGCKYGDEDCTVTSKIREQQYPCESCTSDGIYSLKELNAVRMGIIKTCPYCNHALPED